MGHPPGMKKGRRASSEKTRKTKSRSRSPGDGSRGVRAAAAEKVAAAPVYVDPGAEGDSMGVEGRHRHNAKQIFQYLSQLERVMNDHADVLNDRDVTEELLRRRLDSQAMEIAHVKAIISKADAETKQAIEMNDAKLKEAMETSLKAVWDFLAQNNAGIQQLFTEADASFSRLVKTLKTRRPWMLQSLPTSHPDRRAWHSLASAPTSS